MKRVILCISALFLLLVIACRKKVDVASIFNALTLSAKTALGDGTQTIGVFCEINPAATEDKWEFLLKTTMGQFTESKDNKLIKKPEFRNGKLVIETFVQVPLSNGAMVISVEPNQPTEKRDFIIKDSIIVSKSEAVVINLVSSALGTGSNAQSEIQLTATLFNGSGGKVSQGTKVLFEDFLLGSGASANGRFSEQIVSSGGDLKATTTYAAGNLPVGTDIYLVTTILDAAGARTPNKDTVTVRVNL